MPKKPTDKLEEVQNVLHERFWNDPYKDAGDLKRLKIEIRQDPSESSTVRITVSRMYDYVPLNFEIMKLVSDILGTSNIDEGSRHSYPGCDTCDYGSSYEWTLVCKDCKL